MKTREILTSGLDIMGIAVDDPAIDRLCRYYEELAKWNLKMNLVAKASAQEILENHFLDSLTLLPHIRSLSAPKNLLDVGTGAGFPGLALKTVCPDLAVTLVEPRQKRVGFLRHIVRTLGLDNVNIIEARLEPGPDKHKNIKGSFSIITCRALTRIDTFLELVKKYSPEGGMVICMKGPKGEEEIENWGREKAKIPFALTATHTHELPFSKAARRLIVFTKADQRI
ncbi:MAG: 16S rRNA (guanine(527)-N(7))-methyltransferase RsmG [Desulfobulbaceae bacterium]|nr:16S rRNA (guanine(527)-N(7))-methyltransferase RsmG [Desulfobulbaceae bacterium]